MTISHHLDHASIMAFAAGTLSPALTIVAATHLEMCPVCRNAVLAADEIGGALLADGGSQAVSAACRAAVMERTGAATLHKLPVSSAMARSDMPRSAQAALEIASLDAIPWKRKAPGLAIHRLPMAQGEQGFFGLLRIAPATCIPDHGHGGPEMTLILRGAYQDELGHFGRGDIADLDESVVHTPVVVGDEDCICLVANESPTRFRSWSARLMQKVIGI